MMTCSSCQCVEQELRVRQDDREQVVEIARAAAGEFAHRLRLLLLAQLPLQRALCGGGNRLGNVAEEVEEEVSAVDFRFAEGDEDGEFGAVCTEAYRARPAPIQATHAGGQ